MVDVGVDEASMLVDVLGCPFAPYADAQMVLGFQSLPVIDLTAETAILDVRIFGHRVVDEESEFCVFTQRQVGLGVGLF
jgi:hypothetical protein